MLALGSLGTDEYSVIPGLDTLRTGEYSVMSALGTVGRWVLNHVSPWYPWD